MNTSAALVSAIRGPLLLIAVGILFLVDRSGGYSFTQTWPVLIILYGALKLLERTLVSGQAGGGQSEGQQR